MKHLLNHEFHRKSIHNLNRRTNILMQRKQHSETLLPNIQQKSMEFISRMNYKDKTIKKFIAQLFIEFYRIFGFSSFCFCWCHFQGYVNEKKISHLFIWNLMTHSWTFYIVCILVSSFLNLCFRRTALVLTAHNTRCFFMDATFNQLNFFSFANVFYLKTGTM